MRKSPQCLDKFCVVQTPTYHSKDLVYNNNNDNDNDNDSDNDNDIIIMQIIIIIIKTLFREGKELSDRGWFTKSLLKNVQKIIIIGKRYRKEEIEK